MALQKSSKSNLKLEPFPIKPKVTEKHKISENTPVFKPFKYSRSHFDISSVLEVMPCLMENR